MRALARAVIALYPLAYRRRYGTELEALIEDSEPTPATVLDLAKGAAVAHLRPLPGLAAALAPGERVGAEAVGLLSCWLLVVLAGLGFYKTTENFGAAASAHPLLGGAHLAVQVAALAGALATAAILLWVLRSRRGSLTAATGRRRLHRQAGLGALAAAAMTAITLAAGVYLAALLAEAPALGSEPNGPGGLVSVTASLAIQIAAMAVASGLAIRAARRERQALRL